MSEEFFRVSRYLRQAHESIPKPDYSNYIITKDFGEVLREVDGTQVVSNTIGEFVGGTKLVFETIDGVPQGRSDYVTHKPKRMRFFDQDSMELRHKFYRVRL